MFLVIRSRSQSLVIWSRSVTLSALIVTFMPPFSYFLNDGRFSNGSSTSFAASTSFTLSFISFSISSLSFFFSAALLFPFFPDLPALPIFAFRVVGVGGGCREGELVPGVGGVGVFQNFNWRPPC